METWSDDDLRLSKDKWIDLLTNRQIFKPEDLEILFFVYDQPGHRSTASDIANHFNTHTNKITSINRSLSKRILRHLNQLPQKNSEGGFRYWNIVYRRNEGNQYDPQKHFWWTMRPNLSAAINALYHEKDEYTAIKNNSSSIILEEGRAVDKSIYERNFQARRDCILHYGVICFCCGFDFEKTYGTNGKDKIMVHHEFPLYQRGGVVHRASPIDDLKPICANCHLIIHSKFPAFTIDEVKKMLSGNSIV